MMFNSSVTLSLKVKSWLIKFIGLFPSLASCILCSHNSLASFSFFKTKKSSPDFDGPLIPKISTGDEGSQLSIFLP